MPNDGIEVNPSCSGRPVPDGQVLANMYPEPYSCVSLGHDVNCIATPRFFYTDLKPGEEMHLHSIYHSSISQSIIYCPYDFATGSIGHEEN